MRYLPLPLLVILLLLIVPVHAADFAYNNTRVVQGQCVEIGGTYDISGVIGFSFATSYNTLAWYGRYESGFDPGYDNSSPLYRLELPGAKSAYYSFTIDKNRFGNHTGYWYQFSGEFERAANKRAFYVADHCAVQQDSNITQVNGTAVIIDNNVENILKQQGIVPVSLSTPKLADYVISRYDSLKLQNSQNFNGSYKVWLFGTNDKIYGKDVKVPDNATSFEVFTKSEMGSMEPGSYDLLLQTAGSNKMFELSYNKTKNAETLEPVLRSVNPVDITGFSPKVAEPLVLKFLSNNTDDTYTISKIEIQEPKIEINGYEEIISNPDKIFESTLEVAGFTNLQTNASFTIVIDKNVKTNKSDWFKPVQVIVEAGDPGALRTFHAYIPLNKKMIAPGNHDIVATTKDGAESTVTFFISQSTSPVQPQVTYYSFIEGHPFVPTLPPVTILIPAPPPVTIVVTQTVTVPVTPSQESVNAAQKKATDEILTVIVVVIVAAIIGGYLLLAFIRAVRKKDDDDLLR